MHDGRLYTLAAAGSDSAPSTLVVDTISVERFALRRDLPVAVGHRRLSAGRLAIALDNASPWLATLPAWPRAGVGLRWLERFVDRHGVAGGIKPRPCPADAVEAETARRLGHAVTGLGAALRAGDAARIYEHGSRLIGLGPGLTPSGDDYVLGVATACTLLGPRAHVARAAMARVIDDGADRTNDISHAALAHAARGRVRQSLVDLATALADGDRSTTAFRADRVLAIGATSGTDILAGLLAGLALTTTED
jgi:hypothetical protein